MKEFFIEIRDNVDVSSFCMEVGDKVTSKELGEAIQKYTTVTVCAYCGHESPKADQQAILDHILTCEKRPEKNLLNKAFEIEDKLYGWIEHLVLHSYDTEKCKTCREIALSLRMWTKKDGG